MAVLSKSICLISKSEKWAKMEEYLQLRRSEGVLMHNRVQFGGMKPGDEVDFGEKSV